MKPLAELSSDWLLNGGYSFSELVFLSATAGILLLIFYELSVLLVYSLVMVVLYYRQYRLARRAVKKSQIALLAGVLKVIENEDVDEFVKNLDSLNEELDKVNRQIEEGDKRIKRLSDRFRQITWLARPFIR
ncbi:MAG: hypothetical protein ABDH66_03975 [Bacteroidia bacterium]